MTTLVAGPPTTANPYVGPRSFEEDDARWFFGREREARDLLAQVISERLVVFYAQSGAGKSSLINARLLPGLRDKDFDVLPVGRVSGEIPAGLQPRNVFVFNLIARLQARSTAGAPVKSADELAVMTLAEFLGAEDSAANGTPGAEVTTTYATVPTVLVVDQFEELFTKHPEQWQARPDFFHQLRTALEAFPSLWVVLAMREDYIARLDPYAHLLPNRLQSRYYMQRMSESAALEAVKQPARNAGRPFATGVAETLVANLRQVRSDWGGAHEVEATEGEFVEPVQLQVVCLQLWQRLGGASAGSEITERNIASVAGDAGLSAFVNQALASFYEDALREVLETPGIDLREAELRTWFSTRLLTPEGARGLVRQGTETTGDLPNAAVGVLADRFLLREETRGTSGVWYELVHDRFVQPILESNGAWFQSHGDPVRTATRVWLEHDRDPSRLLRGALLEDAQRFARANPRSLGEDERAFLDASVRGDLEARLSAARTQRWVAVGAVLLMMVSLVAAYAAIRQTQEASTSAAMANAARDSALTQQQLALAQQQAAEQQRQLAEQQRQLAEQQQQLAAQRLLATQARDRLTDQVDLGLLLSVEAYRLRDTAESRGALLTGIQQNPLLITLLGEHAAAVRDVAFSPDGRTLASASDDNTVRLWDVATRQPLGRPMRDTPSPARALAYRPDGQVLAAGADSGQITLWDVATQQPRHTFSGHVNGVKSVDFSPGGSLLASGGNDNVVRLWDSDTGGAIDPPLADNSLGGVVRSVAFSPDGQRLAAGGEDCTVREWDVASRRLLPARAEVPPAPGGTRATCWIWSVAFSPDGKLLATGSADQTVRLWDATTLVPVAAPMAGGIGQVLSVAWSPDGKVLASAGEYKSIVLWDPQSNKALGPPLTSAGGQVWSLAYSPDGRLLASGNADKSIRLWDSPANRLGIGRPASGVPGGVDQVSFSPDDGKVTGIIGCGFREAATSSGLCNVGHWDAAIGQPADPAFEPVGTVGTGRLQTITALSLDGRLLAVNIGRRLVVFDASTLAPQGSPLLVGAPADLPLSLAFSPDHQRLAEGDTSGAIRIWDLTTGQPTGAALQADDANLILILSADGQTLASAGGIGALQIWNLTNKTPPLQLPGRATGINSLAISPDGRVLASGSTDHTVLLRDTTSGHDLGTLMGHTATVTSLAFSPDGKLLASGSADGTVRLWDVATNQAIGPPLAGHTDGEVTSVAFSHDGTRLATAATAAAQWRLIFWEMDPSAWAARACEIANRNLTQSEWQQYRGADVPYSPTCPDLPAGQ